MLQPKIVIDIFESHDLWCAGLALDICPKNSATTACKSQWANEEQQQTPITTTRSSRRPASCTRPIRKSKIYRSLNNWDIIEIILCVHNGTCWAVHIALHMYYYLMAWPGNIDKGDWWLSRTDSELHHHMYFIEYWIMKRNKHHNKKQQQQQQQYFMYVFMKMSIYGDHETLDARDCDYNLFLSFCVWRALIYAFQKCQCTLSLCCY